MRYGSVCPYYQDDSCTIYHGDCLEILPTLESQSIDLVLTDPPYGVNLNVDNSRFSGGHNASKRRQGSGTSGERRQSIAGDDSEFNPHFLLNYGRRQIIWGWNNYPDKLGRGGCLVWIKKNEASFGTFLGDAEIAFVSRANGVYCHKDLSHNSEARFRKHPTQKPLSLFKWCLEKYSKWGEVILDPFMGSGTTLEAAKQLGRKAIGIELEEKYCEIAAERLQQEYMQF